MKVIRIYNRQCLTFSGAPHRFTSQKTAIFTVTTAITAKSVFLTCFRPWLRPFSFSYFSIIKSLYSSKFMIWNSDGRNYEYGDTGICKVKSCSLVACYCTTVPVLKSPDLLPACDRSFHRWLISLEYTSSRPRNVHSIFRLVPLFKINVY